MINMRGNEGFGMLTVMVAAVVLTITAVSFARKISNKTTVSKAADIMAYREMLLEYYTSLAANRAAYFCTRDNNTAPTASFADIDLYDIGSGTSCTSTAAIPVAGRDMKPWDDVTATTTTDCAKNNGQYICIKAQWKQTGSTVEIKISAEFDHEDVGNSDLSAVLRDRSRSVFFGNTTVGISCGVSSGYKGDKPITAIKSYPSQQISCGTHPLIVPEGICPDTSSGGKRGVKSFNATTGAVVCSDMILVKASTPSSGGGGNTIPTGDCAYRAGKFNPRISATGIDATGSITCTSDCNKANDGSPGTCGGNASAGCSNTGQSCSKSCDANGKCTGSSPETTCTQDSDCGDGATCIACPKPNKTPTAAIATSSCGSTTGTNPAPKAITGWDGENKARACSAGISKGIRGKQGRNLCQLVYQYHLKKCTGNTVSNCTKDSDCCGGSCDTSTKKCSDSNADCDQTTPCSGCGETCQLVENCPDAVPGCYRWSL